MMLTRMSVTGFALPVQFLRCVSWKSFQKTPRCDGREFFRKQQWKFVWNSRAALSRAVGKAASTAGHAVEISPEGWMNLERALEQRAEGWRGRAVLCGFHCMFWCKALGSDLTFCLLELKPWDSLTDGTAWECAWSSRTATILCSEIKLCALAQMVSLSHRAEERDPFFSPKTSAPRPSCPWRTQEHLHTHFTCLFCSQLKPFLKSQVFLRLLHAVPAACLTWQKATWQDGLSLSFACKNEK